MTTRTIAATAIMSVLMIGACGGSSTGPEGRRGGECSDGADNDGNGLFDCRDPGCGGAPACSGVDGGLPPDSGMVGDSGGGGLFECCIDRVGYRCPNNASFNQCVGFDLEACLDACPFEDFDCPPSCFDMAAAASPDPSSCSEDPTVDCSGGGGGSCSPGPACDTNADCDSNNCASGACYDTANGCLCDTNRDCTSNNCASGVCTGNGVGAACDTNADCDSNNCSGGTCWGNGPGDMCDTNADCRSDNCSGGVCQGR